MRLAGLAVPLRLLRPTRLGAARIGRRSGLTKAGLANRFDGAIEALHLDECGSAAVAVGMPLRNQSAPCRLDLAFRRIGGQPQFDEGAVDVLFHSLVLFTHCESAGTRRDQLIAMLRRSISEWYSLPGRVSGGASELTKKRMWSPRHACRKTSHLGGHSPS